MILAMIHNKYNTLTATEKKIASYVLQNPRKVMELTAKELAISCGTVQSAVIRFCKSIEITGFADLKLALARETAIVERTEDLPAFSQNDDTETVFRKVFFSGIHTLKDTLSMLDFDRLEKIVHLLVNAQNVYIFGIGTSSTVAMDAGYRFSQFGIPAHACTDSLFMNVIAGNLKVGDVAFGISHSGQTKSVVDALRRAGSVGAATIALTSFADSKLSQESDLSICVYPDEKNYPVEAVSARVAHICVIDALMMVLGIKQGGGFEKHIAIRNEALKDIRY